MFNELEDVKPEAKDIIKALTFIAVVSAFLLISIFYFPGFILFIARHVGILTVLGGVCLVILSARHWFYQVPGSSQWVFKKAIGEEGAKATMFSKGIFTLIFGIVLILILGF